MTPTLRILLAAAACSTLAGCRADRPDELAAPPPPTREPAAPTPGSTPLVSLALEDAPALEPLKAAAAFVALPLRIQPDAQAIVDCARVSVTTGGRVPPAEAILAVSRAVRPYGLILFQGPSELFVRKAPGDASKTCVTP